eukprot:2100543-Rhodomonas_salina.3
MQKRDSDGSGCGKSGEREEEREKERNEGGAVATERRLWNILLETRSEIPSKSLTGYRMANERRERCLESAAELDAPANDWREQVDVLRLQLDRGSCTTDGFFKRVAEN